MTELSTKSAISHASQRPSGAPLRRHGGQSRLSVDKRHVPARPSRPAPVLWGSCRGRPRCFCVGRPRRREISAAAKVTLIDQNPSFGVRRTVIYIFKSVPWPACISSICLSAWHERKGSPNPLVTKLGGPGAGWVGGSPAEFRGQRVGPGHLAATVSAAKRPRKRRARGRPNAHKSACANEGLHTPEAHKTCLAHLSGCVQLTCRVSRAEV